MTAGVEIGIVLEPRNQVGETVARAQLAEANGFEFIGITDGQMTQVTGEDLREGMQVITGVTQGAAPAAATNPFQQQQPQRFGPGRGM